MEVGIQIEKARLLGSENIVSLLHNRVLCSHVSRKDVFYSVVATQKNAIFCLIYCC